VPEEYRSWESAYVGEEPTGNPIRTADEWGKGVPPGEPEAIKAPYDELERLQKKGANAKPDVYGKLAKSTETAFKQRIRGSVAKCLKTLQKAIEPAVAAAKPSGDTPWKALNSPGINKAADHYIAERYFKGKWLAGKSGPKNTSGTADTEIAKQKDSLSTNTDKNAEGSTGDGKVVKPPSEKGTGSAKPDAPPGTTGTGGGAVKTGSGTGPGY
jgi:hypothetical protein